MRRTWRSVLKTHQQQVLEVAEWTTYFVSRMAWMPWSNSIKYINELGMIFEAHWVPLRYCHWDSSLRALSNETEGQPVNLLYMAENYVMIFLLTYIYTVMNSIPQSILSQPNLILTHLLVLSDPCLFLLDYTTPAYSLPMTNWYLYKP